MLIMNHYHENPNIIRSTQSSNTSSCIPRASPHYIYRGKRDQYGLREKEGYNEIKTDDFCEIYEGNFIYDNQHGNGVYRWTSDKGKTVYEGHIYCNTLHGYGRFSYPDGSVFEGLYKDNCRYGPGVLTESDGKQSVGIWRNKKLIKLAVKVETGVPILGTTPSGKARVNWFKNVVPINKTIKDKAKEIFIEMKAPLYLLEFSENLYNILVKDNRSEAFIWRPYEEIYRRKSPEKLAQGIIQTVIKTEAKFKAGRFRKKGKVANKWKELIAELERKKAANEVLVLNATHLVAWNNSAVMKDMLVFSFKHTDQEEIVNFDVTDILKCNRDRFRASGTHETLCIRFLKNCEVGEQLRVHDYLAFKGIDPNLADAEGNTALIIAAANDQLAVIDVLLDRGADINMCNDEGFTPLGLCVTRYLALKNDVKDWEKTFLRNPGELAYPENTLKWRHQGEDLEEYVRSSDSEDKIKMDEARPETKQKPEELSEETLIKLAIIKETILKLIDRGAEPHKCVVPMPVFRMAVNSGDVEIVTCLLEARFKQEGRMQDAEDLHEALFAVVQMPPDDKMVALCTTLIKYGADANAKILGTHEDENTFKLCELMEGEKGMKTPLHTVVTRHDGIIYNEYLCSVVKLLLNNKADPDALFFGHTPLSAAIVKGNAGMVKCLMDTSQIDPNQKLGKNLGVPLTVLFSQECARKLPPENAMCIVDILVNSGAQLLSDLQVENFTGNVIEFAHDELDEFKRQSKKDKNKRGNIHGYQSLVDYVTKLAQQCLINKVKEILWRSSQPFASYGIKMSQIRGTSRRVDKASLKNALTSSKMTERTSSKDALTSSKIMETMSSKDALTSSKMKERTSSNGALTSSKIKETMSLKDELTSSKIKDRSSSKDASPSTKTKERVDKMSTKDASPSLKTKERVDRYNSKDSLPSSKMKERVDILGSKEVMPFAKKTKSDILKSPPEGLPTWLTAEDIVEIINLIQEKELTRISREQASVVLGTIMSRDSKDVDQEKLGKLLSLVGVLEGSEDDSKRKKSEKIKEKEQKMHGNKSGKMSGRKSKDRKSWNILTALRRPRATTGAKARDFQTIVNGETDKDPKNSDVCFGCGRNFTQDLLRLCPVCKQVKFCSAECFWKSRNNNSHTCIGDIFPDWKDEPVYSEFDRKEADSPKKNKKVVKKISLDTLKKNNDALEDNLYKSEFKNKLEKDWKSTKNVMSGRKSSRLLK